MSKELVQINESDLQLVVNEQTIGVLETNALQLKGMVEQMLPRYDVSNYSADDVNTAKEDKSKLNKFAKALNDKRIEIERQWMAPFDEFKTTIKDTVDLIKECSTKIDNVVKEVENKEKEEKRQQINELLERLEVEKTIEVSKIWSDKWLNKTTSLKSIEKEISERIAKINADIETLKTLYPDHVDAVVLHYKNNLNLNEAIEWGKTLVATAKHRAEEAKHEEEKPVADSPKEVVEEAPVSESDDVDDAFASVFGDEDKVQQPEEVEEKELDHNLLLELHVTDKQKAALERFLTINNIEYLWR